MKIKDLNVDTLTSKLNDGEFTTVFSDDNFVLPGSDSITFPLKEKYIIGLNLTQQFNVGPLEFRRILKAYRDKQINLNQLRYFLGQMKDG